MLHDLTHICHLIILGKPEIVLEGNFKAGYFFGRNYDLHPDGQTFVMLQEKEIGKEANRINIVHNWTCEIERIFDQQSKR